MPFADQPAPNKNTTIIDPDGDIILVMGDSWTSNGRRFQVSSKLLSLASPTFKTLLLKFTQASDASFIGHEVSLEEGDEAAMEILLSMLHFHNTDQYSTLTPSRLATVSRLSDKYSTNKALKPFTTQWLRGFATSDVKVTSYGPLLEAAWHFDRDDFFTTLSVGAIKHLPSQFRVAWASENIAPDLPSTIKAAMRQAIGKHLSKLRVSIEAIEPKLRTQWLAITRFPTPGRYCPCCGRVHAFNAKTCHPCKNKFLYDAFCTRDFRISEAFNFLTRAKLWPSVEPFQTLSISAIVGRIRQARELTFRLHTCDEGANCPLKAAFRDLEREADDLLDAIKGVDFRTLSG